MAKDGFAANDDANRLEVPPCRIPPFAMRFVRRTGAD